MAVPSLRYGCTIPIENGKQTAQPFVRYGNNKCANISNFLAFVLSLAVLFVFSALLLDYE